MAAKRKLAKKVSRKKATTASIQPLSPCLWFDGNAEDAAKFWVSVFKKGKITSVTRYPKAGQEVHGKAVGSVMTVEFTLNGMPLMGLNGGPDFKFNEAVSLMILCDTQAEIDYYWDKLLEGGGAPSACGWLKDKFGFSWQVVPRPLMKIWRGPDSPAKERAFAAMMQMVKLDIAQLKAAYKGK